MLILVGGGGLLAYLIYDWLQYRMRSRLRRESKEKGMAKRVSYDWKVYFMVGFTVLLTYLFARPIEREIPVARGLPPDIIIGRCLLVAGYILLIGLVWAYRQAGKELVSERRLINEQVAELVSSFRSVFRIRPTVFSALEESNKKIDPPTGTAVAHAVTTFYVTALPRRALEELQARIKNAYMDQFIYILERGEDAKHEDIMTALDGLLIRLRRARELRDQSEVNMTVVSGQTRVIQLIAITMVLIVGIFERLRVAYESVPGQLVFVFFATIGVVTSWYIDSQAQKLKEKVL